MLRILIADDATVTCQPFREQLRDEAEMRLVSMARTAEEARLHLDHTDVVLVGRALPDALALVDEISRKRPDLQVLVAGIEEDPRQILRYVEAGATGYLLRNEPAERMIQKVQATSHGEALVSERVAASLMARVATLANNVPSPISPSLIDVDEKLTPRQQEVLNLIMEEMSNRQIASRLQIQVGTVKNHVHQILKRLDVRDRYEAAAAYGCWLKQEGAKEAYVTL